MLNNAKKFKTFIKFYQYIKHIEKLYLNIKKCLQFQY